MALLQADLLKLFPSARTDYLAALERNERLLTENGILADPLCLCHFLAQAAHETGGFTILSESGSYSAERLRQIFPRYFTPAQARVYARKPQAILSRAYANRMGNGPEYTGDGWKFRGRWLLQRTGKGAYARSGARLGVDLVANPDLLIEDGNLGLKDALLYWSDLDLGKWARDLGSTHEGVLAISRGINAGNPRSSIQPNGFADRKRLFERVWEFYCKGTHVTSVSSKLNPAADGVLEEGEEGVAVENLQKRLAALGYSVGEADGVFGSRTKAAVAAFAAREKGILNQAKIVLPLGQWSVKWDDYLDQAQPFEDAPRQDVSAKELAEKGDKAASLLIWLRRGFASVAAFLGIDTAADQAGVQLPQTLTGLRQAIDSLAVNLQWLAGSKWAIGLALAIGGACAAHYGLRWIVARYRSFEMVRP